jgi:hypothetical protein
MQIVPLRKLELSQDRQVVALPEQVKQFSSQVWHVRSAVFSHFPAGQELMQVLSFKKYGSLQEVHVVALVEHVRHVPKQF